MIGKFINSSRGSRAWRLFALFMAVVIVFSTTYSMILPAIAISDDAADQEPGMDYFFLNGVVSWVFVRIEKKLDYYR